VIVNLYTHVYEKEKVLNDTITLEFAMGLVVENNGVSLNWATYVLVAHEKWVSLQVGRDIKRAISQPATISKEGKGLQGALESKNVLKPKYAKGVVGISGGKNSFGG
jgi:hypothetical protein